MVGALIVRDQEILARGYHEKAGGAHAEVAALEQLDGTSAKGADISCLLNPVPRPVEPPLYAGNSGCGYTKSIHWHN